MKRLLPIILISWIVFVTSCNEPRYIYNQDVRNLHYFTGRGQSKIGVNWATGPSRNDVGTVNNYNHGFDLQAAYAISSHFALTGGYFSRNEKDFLTVYLNQPTSYQYDVTYQRRGWELGGSFYTPFNPRKIAFFYVDAGLGSGTNRLADNGIFDTILYPRHYDNNQFRFFIQPGLYTGRGAVQFNMGIRWQYTAYSNISTNYTNLELSAYSLTGLRELQMFEPYIGFRFGHPDLPWIKGDLQASFSSPNSSYYYIRGGYLSFGLIFDPFATKRKPGF